MSCFSLRKIIARQPRRTAIEYALIASLISVAAIAGFTSLGGKVHSIRTLSRTSQPRSNSPGLIASRRFDWLARRLALRRGEQEK